MSEDISVGEGGRPGQDGRDTAVLRWAADCWKAEKRTTNFPPKQMRYSQPTKRILCQNPAIVHGSIAIELA